MPRHFEIIGLSISLLNLQILSCIPLDCPFFVSLFLPPGSTLSPSSIQYHQFTPTVCLIVGQHNHISIVTMLNYNLSTARDKYFKDARLTGGQQRVKFLFYKGFSISCNLREDLHGLRLTKHKKIIRANNHNNHNNKGKNRSI
jgi:hypothetical protein